MGCNQNTLWDAFRWTRDEFQVKHNEIQSKRTMGYTRETMGYRISRKFAVTLIWRFLCKMRSSLD